MWWLTLEILALRQEDYEFIARLSYRVIPCLKQITKQTNKNNILLVVSTRHITKAA